MFNRFLLLLFLYNLASCVHRSTDPYAPQPFVEVAHPAWTNNATIYEVNVRQYTPDGTFAAFAKHLPRLKQMGIDIIWLMPVHPIGIRNRKGTLGSYYSVKDYYGINPEFGTMDDFKSLVRSIHQMGMHVIIDWVGNHSAWDNALVADHPDWYLRSREGSFESTPWRDYDDIIDFDYEKPGVRKYMTEALKFWVKETGIDGFRCDVASFMPTDFWNEARKELDAIKPVFMLAESESKDLHQHAFDATYAWSLWDQLHRIALEGATIDALTGGYIAEHVSVFPRGGMRMLFTDNHDKNSWEGNQVSNFGAALPACMVLCGTMDGMPLVYSGQEAGLDRSLRFFDKDTIQWKSHSNAVIYEKLFALKHRNHALWNGDAGGVMERVRNDAEHRVLSFVREKDGDKVLIIVNLSAVATTVRVDLTHDLGSYSDIFSGERIVLKNNVSMSMEPWGYRVLDRVK